MWKNDKRRERKRRKEKREEGTENSYIGESFNNEESRNGAGKEKEGVLIFSLSKKMMWKKNRRGGTLKINMWIFFILSERYLIEGRVYKVSNWEKSVDEKLIITLKCLSSCLILKISLVFRICLFYRSSSIDPPLVFSSVFHCSCCW